MRSRLDLFKGGAVRPTKSFTGPWVNRPLGAPGGTIHSSAYGAGALSCPVSGLPASLLTARGHWQGRRVLALVWLVPCPRLRGTEPSLTVPDTAGRPTSVPGAPGSRSQTHLPALPLLKAKEHGAQPWAHLSFRSAPPCGTRRGD